jgi:type IV pilus assembly protein PilE
MVAAVRPSPTRHAIRGFTLIELMIVVVVIAVLSLIALPAYTSYVQKSRRAEAMTLINQIAQAQERWRSTCPTYASLPNTATAAPPNHCDVATSGLAVPNPSSGYYTAAIPVATAASYQITADAAGAQAGDAKCTRLTMTVSGGNIQYDSVGTAASSVCWSR